MDTTLQISLLIIIILYYVGMVRMLSRGRMNLRYALLWLAVGLAMLLLVLFPGTAEKAFHLVGVKELTNGIFAAALFGIIIITTSITSIVSMLSNKIKSTIQALGILEKRVRELEDENMMLKQRYYAENENDKKTN